MGAVEESIERAGTQLTQIVTAAKVPPRKKASARKVAQSYICTYIRCAQCMDRTHICCKRSELHGAIYCVARVDGMKGYPSYRLPCPRISIARGFCRRSRTTDTRRIGGWWPFQTLILICHGISVRISTTKRGDYFTLS